MAFNCQRYPKIFSLFLTFSHFFSLFIIFYHFLSFFTTFVFIIYVTKILSKLIPTNLGTNIVSCGEAPNDRFREGSGAGSQPRSEPQVPGRFRGSWFRTTGSGQVPNHVPNHGFRWFRGRFQFTSSGTVPGKVPNQVPIHEFRGRFRTTFRTTGSGKVPGQVPMHEFRDFRGRFRFTGCGGRIGKRRERRFSLLALLPNCCRG